MSTQVFAVILSVFPAQTSYLQETQYPEFAPLRNVCLGICSNTLVSFHTHLTCKKLSALDLHHSNNYIVWIDILLRNVQIIILYLCSSSSSNYTTIICFDYFYVHDICFSGLYQVLSNLTYTLQFSCVLFSLSVSFIVPSQNCWFCVLDIKCIQSALLCPTAIPTHISLILISTKCKPYLVQTIFDLALAKIIHYEALLCPNILVKFNQNMVPSY